MLIDLKCCRRWYFYVQMVGYEEQAQHYSMEMTICRPDEGEIRLTVLSLRLNILPAVCQGPEGNTLRRSPEIFARWRSQVLRLQTRKVSVWRSETEPWTSISSGTKIFNCFFRSTQPYHDVFKPFNQYSGNFFKKCFLPKYELGNCNGNRD